MRRVGYVALSLLLLARGLIRGVSGQFVLKDTYIGKDFLERWDWETEDDPTHGRVNYVDKQTAMNSNLSYASGSTFVMRADDHQIVSPKARGRNSVRVHSQATYSESIVVLDLAHMPVGCSTWPAFWTLSAKGPWPHGGEIDIIEGANLDQRNLASLHTTPNCVMQQQRFQSGETTSTNCDASVNYNQGCGVSFAKPGSFGTPFNAQRGGYYVLARSSQKTQSLISTLTTKEFTGVAEGAALVKPDERWGWPEAVFPMDITGGSCGYEEHFDAHQIVFDLTFCGDWAGSLWPSSGCGLGSCEDFVNKNPKAFSNAYWEVNSLRVYTPL